MPTLYAQDNINPKNRFFADIKAYIKKLIAQIKESKDVINSLVTDLKKTIKLIVLKQAIF